MDVQLINQQSDFEIDLARVHEAVPLVIHHEGQDCDEVAIHFVDEPTICKLHDEFFQDPTSTDCISFPMDPEGEDYRVLGEVFICPLVAATYAKEHRGDPKRELFLYLVHGLLHLMGYDDIEDEDRAQMRLAEARHMEHLESLGWFPEEGN